MTAQYELFGSALDLSGGYYIESGKISGVEKYYTGSGWTTDITAGHAYTVTVGTRLGQPSYTGTVHAPIDDTDDKKVVAALFPQGASQSLGNVAGWSLIDGNSGGGGGGTIIFQLPSTLRMGKNYYSLSPAPSMFQYESQEFSATAYNADGSLADLSGIEGDSLFFVVHKADGTLVFMVPVTVDVGASSFTWTVTNTNSAVADEWHCKIQDIDAGKDLASSTFTIHRGPAMVSP